MKWYAVWSVIILTLVLCIVVVSKSPDSGTEVLNARIEQAERTDAAKVAQLALADKSSAEAESIRADAQSKRAGAILAVAVVVPMILLFIAVVGFVLRPPWARR